MSRIVAIDYGSKRSGIAVTDELKMIASGLTTVDTKVLLTWLKDYCAKEDVDLFVIGEPKRMHGQSSAIEGDIQVFIQKLQQQLPSVEIKRMDERFTSKMAFDVMLASGISKKKRRDKKLVDQISATIILQDYLHYHT